MLFLAPLSFQKKKENCQAVTLTFIGHALHIVQLAKHCIFSVLIPSPVSYYLTTSPLYQDYFKFPVPDNRGSVKYGIFNPVSGGAKLKG
jgi:hypothetical protein